MKRITLLLIAFLSISSVFSQVLQNTSWLIFNPSLSDTVTVLFKTDTVKQYVNTDSLLVGSLYWESSDTIKLVDVEGSLGCTNPDTGFYEFVISSDSLYISLITDDCTPRGITYDGVVLWKADRPNSIDEYRLFEEVEFQMYPNPSSPQSSVLFSANGNGLISLYNLFGQQVMDDLQYQTGKTMSLSLNSGVYIVRFSTKSGFYTSKLFIE